MNFRRIPIKKIAYDSFLTVKEKGWRKSFGTLLSEVKWEGRGGG